MNKEMADRLIRLRKEHQLTQDDLAQKLFVSRQAVSKWERGEALPDIDNLTALASLYDVSLDELLGRAGTTGSSEGEKPEAISPSDPEVKQQKRGKLMSNYQEREMEKRNDQAKMPLWTNILHGIIPLLAVVVFFILQSQSVTMAWLVFLAIPIYWTAYGTVLNSRRDK
ncbi:MAG: helix-turn-helix domain-containing protein [Actinomycetia bacterium]|nr:helix-turn-helix domain-containing protein [Actinomycetes bacterium]